MTVAELLKVLEAANPLAQVKVYVYDGLSFSAGSGGCFSSADVAVYDDEVIFS